MLLQLTLKMVQYILYFLASQDFWIKIDMMCINRSGTITYVCYVWYRWQHNGEITRN